jgi:hypothetical protein
VSLEPIKGVVSFSDYFELDRQTLEALDAFNPLLGLDLPFAIDPKLLEDSDVPELQGAYDDLLGHFRRILTLLQASQTPGDRAWRQAEKLLDFPEFRGPA